MTQRYQLTLNQAFNTTAGDLIQNVFFYENVGVAQNAELLATAFEDQVLDNIATIQSAAIKINSIQVINLDDPLDYFVLAPTTPAEGAVTGDCLPQFVCWSFRLNRVSRSVRNGQKRIAGVPETLQVNGVAVAGASTDLTALADAMGTNLTDVSGANYTPRIGRRPLPGHPLSDTVLFAVRNVNYVRISTQNSRKTGHGA